MTRPLCACHGEPMHRNGIEPTGTLKWRCRVDNNERTAALYESMDGVAYNRLLLYGRRYKALRRREKRGSLSREG